MSHAHTPPELPEITDEAGETPRWVPMLGAALFALAVALIWWSHRQHDAAAEAPAVEGAELAN
jgi:hypothetical protein